MRFVHGHILMGKQLLEESRLAEAAWRELEWIATHYDEATPEQRAALDRTLEAIREMEDDAA